MTGRPHALEKRIVTPRVRWLAAIVGAGWGATLGAALLLPTACVSKADDADGGAAACEELLVQTPCFDCLESSCCDETRACLDDRDGCAACVGGDAEACGGDVTSQLLACAVGECLDRCGPNAPVPQCDAPAKAASGGSCAPEGEGVACNPLTNASCDEAAGEVCDFDTGGFRCFPGPNERALCEACGGDDGFCGPGLSCYRSIAIEDAGVVITGSCARTCCDDGDCEGGSCGAVLEAGGASVGVCLVKGGSK